ncbi:uncharacterized protein LOC118564712 [Fundulus heteroclitus]|uniref:uncharacterized protein LOC118564712 n=1 Tax=Fundulus heteroclitus TaxID=8078 RepID=UPI00165B3F21|nr:uncharacterized protein LOC118564712 [Fundulus heteroclitus]
MSDVASETGPEKLAKDEQQDCAAAEEEQTAPGNLQEDRAEDSGVMENEAQAKMMSAFEQVRNQIRSQGAVKAPKSSILQLVSKIKDIEAAAERANSRSDGNVAEGEEGKEAEALKDGSRGELDLRLEMLSKVFEKKLQASKKVLRDEFEVQICEARKEMQAYTDQTLKELERKITGRTPHSRQEIHPKPLQEGADAAAKRRASAAPSLASRRGKMLTRTLTTTIIPTAPVISGLKGSPKGQSLPVRDHVLSLSQSQSQQGRIPLPPARPPLHTHRKSVQAKCKTGT